MMRTLATVAAVISLCVASAWAFTRDEVLLYVPFEGSAEPAVAVGEA